MNFSGIQFTPLTFHTVRGKHIALTHAYTVAERHAGEYACGYVFTSRPLALNEKIVIQVIFKSYLKFCRFETLMGKNSSLG